MSPDELYELGQKVLNGNISVDELSVEDVLHFVESTHSIACGGDCTIICRIYNDLLRNLITTNNSQSSALLLFLAANSANILEALYNGIREGSREKRVAFWEKEYWRNRERILRKGNSFSQKKHFEGKGCVYSVITGAYDDVHEIQDKCKDLDYILFTNNRDIKSQSWRVIYIDNDEGLSDVLLARKTKILGHPYLEKYDYTIYIDGKFCPNNNIHEYVTKYRGDQSMLCFPHPGWCTVSDEIVQVVNQGKIEQDLVEKQWNYYLANGYKDDYGLCDTGILIRDKDDSQLQQVMQDWWKEVSTRSHRDQISFTYVAWKNNYCFDLCIEDIYDNEYFEYIEHNS